MSTNSRMSYILYAALVMAHLALPLQAHAQFTISGTVTDPGAAPVANVDVLLFDSNGNPLGIPATLTNSAGFYTIDNPPFGLPADNYQVRFDPPTATGLLFAQIPVSVSTNTTLNVSLVAGNILSGFVRDTLGVGIPNIDLNFRDENTGDVLNPPGDNTDATGFYNVVIPSAFYRLTYRPVNGEPLIAVELRDVPVFSDTTINITMTGAWTISGHVQDVGGTPVFDADFDAVESATGVKLVTPGDNTDISGNYSFLVPPGTYDVNVTPLLPDRLAPQLVPGVVVNGDVTMNFVLKDGVLLSGTVTNSFSSPVVGADIDVTDIVNGVTLFTPSDKTDGAGLYQVIVPVGVYHIDIQPLVATGLAPVRFPATPVNIDTTIDYVAPNGVTVTGTVQSFSGPLVTDVDIDAKDAATLILAPLLGDNTGATGVFTTVLPTGVFNIEVEPPQSRRLAPQLLLSLPLNVDTALTITLDSALLLNGNVTDSNLNPLGSIRLTAKPSAGGDTAFIPGNKTDSLGQYAALLTPGTYDLLFRPDSTLSITDSTVLSAVTLSNDTTINIILGQLPEPTFTLSGTVTDPIAAPVANAEVRLLVGGSAQLAASPTTTDGAGFYSFVTITAGTYDMQFIPQTGMDLLAKTITGVVVSDNTIQDAALEFCGGTCGCCQVAGDADHSGTMNIADVTFEIARIFSGGPAPFCQDEADANGTNAFNIADVTFLIARIFSGGPPPTCGTTGS